MHVPRAQFCELRGMVTLGSSWDSPTICSIAGRPRRDGLGTILPAALMAWYTRQATRVGNLRDSSPPRHTSPLLFKARALRLAFFRQGSRGRSFGMGLGPCVSLGMCAQSGARAPPPSDPAAHQHLSRETGCVCRQAVIPSCSCHLSGACAQCACVSLVWLGSHPLGAHRVQISCKCRAAGCLAATMS